MKHVTTYEQVCVYIVGTTFIDITTQQSTYFLNSFIIGIVKLIVWMHKPMTSRFQQQHEHIVTEFSQTSKFSGIFMIV